MISKRQVFAGLLFVCVLSSGARAFAQGAADPVTEALQAVTNTVPTPASTFVGITPCRLVDTRGNGFSGPFGPPSLVGQAPGGAYRFFPVAGNCNIPAAAQALSANFAVTNTTGTGFISVWPGDGAQPVPLVASMNFSAGQTIANAVLVPLGPFGMGGINVFARVTTDLVIDVNGYFISAPQNVACGFGQSVTGFDAAGAAICGTPVATFVGPQKNTPISALRGWTQCYSDTYANTGTPLMVILGACSGNNLLLGCRQTGSSTLLTFAHAPRADVLFDTGTDAVTTHNANGTEWYFNNSWSWGYAPAGQAVNKNECDVSPGATAGDRLCWHTGGGSINTGYLCGTFTGLNGSTAFERLIFQAN